MQRVRLKHVHKVTRRTSRGEEIHYYHRITREKLPDDDQARAARVLEINATLGASVEPEASRPGTFADLVARYRASRRYLNLADSSRKDYAPHLDAIVEAWGQLRVIDLRRKHAYEMQESLAGTPRAADKRITILGRIIQYGIDVDSDVFGQQNVTARFERIHDGEGYAPWPEHVISAFADAAYPELRAVAIAGLLNTGQRSSDTVAMEWCHYDGTGIEVERQKKTGERLWIPASAEFRALVDPLPRPQGPGADRSPIFLTKTRKPWTYHNLNREAQALLNRLGYEGYTLHGLRFRAAGRIVAAGGSWDDVAAVLGHRTMQMARRYAERKERAQAAVTRIDEAKAERKESKTVNGQG